MGTPENLKITGVRSDGLGGLVILGADELRAVLTPSRCLAALEDAYRSYHEAPADKARSLGFQAGDGKFHVKAGLYPGTHEYFAAKINANFPDNQKRYDLPTIQGLIVLCDGSDGHPLAILHSGELTGLRTAAATALAARHGARPDARTLAVIGCGAQSRHQAQAIMGVLPIRCIAAFDCEPAIAESFAAWAGETPGLNAATAATIPDAARSSDIIVTCTTSTSPILTTDMVMPGSFIAAVGADNPDKHEIDPALFANARILVDDPDQCASDGDLAHAIRAGTATLADVAATLAQLAAGARPGRTCEDEIVIFDSTGTGLQDVAAAAAAYDAVGKDERR